VLGLVIANLNWFNLCFSAIYETKPSVPSPQDGESSSENEASYEEYNTLKIGKNVYTPRVITKSKCCWTFSFSCIWLHISIFNCGRINYLPLFSVCLIAEIWDAFHQYQRLIHINTNMQIDHRLNMYLNPVNGSTLSIRNNYVFHKWIWMVCNRFEVCGQMWVKTRIQRCFFSRLTIISTRKSRLDQWCRRSSIVRVEIYR